MCVQGDDTKVSVNATRFGGDTHVVCGLQCWHRSAAGPDVVCVEGRWQTVTAASGGWRELWEKYTREKSTRNKDVLEEWVCENSNLVKNVTYSNRVKNNQRT